MSTWLLLWAILLAAEEPLPAEKAASEPRPTAKAAESLDDELRKNLGGTLVDELGEKPQRVDEDLKKSLGAGEDIGEQGDPLTRIGDRMRKTQELIGQAKTSDNTQELQRQIVTDLDQLIQQIKQQQRRPSSKSAMGGRSGKASQPQRPSAQSGNQPQQDKSRNSSDKLRDEQARKNQLAETKKTLANLWGDLPGRTRDEALQSIGDGFLPKYDLQIRKYFERLGEEQPHRR